MRRGAAGFSEANAGAAIPASADMTKRLRVIMLSSNPFGRPKRVRSGCQRIVSTQRFGSCEEAAFVDSRIESL
jgi:hypothetical protein